jgi:hypothetical protein
MDLLKFFYKGGKLMDQGQDYFEVIRRARRDVWEIVIDLLQKNIEIDMILHVLMVKQEDIEEVRSVLLDIEETVSLKVAISLAKDATSLGLSVLTIEEKTGIHSSMFVEYLDIGEKLDDEG